MIAKVCDRESRRDTWFENRLVILYDACLGEINWTELKMDWNEIKFSFSHICLNTKSITSHFQYLYAFNIVPMNKIEKDELVKQPQDVTECPYSWSERKQQQQQVRD